MNTYVAVLRGINVSGSKLLKMADLKIALKEIGLKEVETYIQSGNIKFSSPETDSLIIETNIQQMLKDRYGYDVPVIVLQKYGLEKVTSSNPFLLNGVEDHKALYVTFLAEMPASENLKSLEDIKSGDDQFELIGQTIYLYCPAGYGRTKLTNNLFEKKLGVTATSRNWKTVLKLLEMAT